MKINDFTDLIVWQKGHQLVLFVYEVTRGFPKDELYALTSQLRRSVVSVTSNIAEGFGRQTKKEKIQFYYMASGSLTELRNQLIIVRDLGYIERKEFEKLNECAIEVNKMIHGLIKSIKAKL
jgi:four helix bundle protein